MTQPIVQVNLNAYQFVVCKLTSDCCPAHILANLKWFVANQSR